MNRVWILTKLFLKTSIGSGSKANKKMSKKILTIIGMIILIPMILVAIGSMVFGVYTGLKSIGQQGLVLALGYSLSATVIFIFGIMSVMSVLYFSKDVEYVLPLPFKAHEITLAKFITVIIYQYAWQAMIIAPIVVIYGIGEGLGVLYYLISLICFMMLPIIPTLYSSIISMILIRFTSISKHKDTMKVIGGFIALIIGVGVNFLTSSMGNKLDNNPQKIKEIIEAGNNSLLSGMSDIFMTPRLATLATLSSDINKSIINLGLFLLVNIIAIALFIVIADILYLKGAVGISESYSKREKLTGEKLSKNITQNSVLKTWVIKELKLLFRTPAYLLNCVSTIILIPILLIIPVISNGGISNIMEVGSFLSNPEKFTLVIGGFFGIIAFITGTNPTAATSISREGDNIFISKYLPVNYVTQIIAKVISGVIINLAIVVIALIGFIVVGMPISLVLLLTIIAFLEVLLLNAMGVLLDLQSPKLVWDNEQKAVKQNFNSFKSMILSLIIGAIGAVAIIILNLYFVISFIILAIVLLVGNLLMYKLIKTSGVKMFKKIADD